jgi:hypothetical protein
MNADGSEPKRLTKNPKAVTRCGFAFWGISFMGIGAE